jgi:hypothetical protein
MEIISVKQTAPAPTIACDNCSGSMRLVGSEPDPINEGAELLTYACVHCQHVQAMPMANAGRVA